MTLDDVELKNASSEGSATTAAQARLINGEAPLEDPEVHPTITREKWTHKADFVLSLIGYAVGVGNLWRFPYLCLRNGGGAFLIPYFFFLLTCGIPLFYLEVCLGQFSGVSSMFVWKLCPLFKGLGYGTVIVSGLACLYYNAVITWIIYYLGSSFLSTLPWTSCDNWWNTESCIRFTKDALSLNSTKDDAANDTAVGRSAAEEFWKHNVLRISSGLDDVGEIQWHLVLSLLGAWCLVFLCLVKGVKSLGKVVYVTVLLPYVLLTIFLVRGAMLPGAGEGILFYITPNFSKLANYKVWVEACIQVFYSLGPAWGGLITMASFNEFNNNCFRDAVIATMADGLTSFYGGFVIFGVLGHMAHESNTTVEVIATQGPGLAFVAYPEAITKLPLPQLWSVIFFLMLLMLGIDSQFGMFETLVSGLIDAFPRYLTKHRMALTACLTMVSFLLGLPMCTNAGYYVFVLMDWFVAAFCVLLTSFIECIVIGWIYGVDRFCDDIEMMMGKRPGLAMKLCWVFFTPFLMLMAFIFTIVSYEMPSFDGYHYPTYARGLGFFISVLSIIPIPTMIIWQLVHLKGSFRQRLMDSLRPSADWGPSMSTKRGEYQAKSYSTCVLPFRSTINLIQQRL